MIELGPFDYLVKSAEISATNFLSTLLFNVDEFCLLENHEVFAGGLSACVAVHAYGGKSQWAVSDQQANNSASFVI